MRNRKLAFKVNSDEVAGSISGDDGPVPQNDVNFVG